MYTGRKSIIVSVSIWMESYICIGTIFYTCNMKDWEETAVWKEALSKHNCLWLLLSIHTLQNLLLKLSSKVIFYFQLQKKANRIGSEFDHCYCTIWNPQSYYEMYNFVCLSLQDCRRTIKLSHCYCTGNGKKIATRIKSVTSFKHNVCNSVNSLQAESQSSHSS